MLGIERGERDWATWSEASGYLLHSSKLRAIESLIDEARAADGHKVIVSGDAEILGLADMVRDASGAEVCAPFDDDTANRSRKVAAAGSRRDLLVATDASVRRKGSGAAISTAAFDGSSLKVSAHRVPRIGVYAAEIAGILSGAQVPPPGLAPLRRRIFCDSQGAVRAVAAMNGMKDGDLAIQCEKIFGPWVYSPVGRRIFEYARRSAQEMSEGVLEVQWVKGHDDEAVGVAHDLNVIADQTARALSLVRGELGDVQRAQVRGVAGALGASRFPKADFLPGPGIR